MREFRGEWKLVWADRKAISNNHSVHPWCTGKHPRMHNTSRGMGCNRRNRVVCGTWCPVSREPKLRKKNPHHLVFFCYLLIGWSKCRAEPNKVASERIINLPYTCHEVSGIPLRGNGEGQGHVNSIETWHKSVFLSFAWIFQFSQENILKNVFPLSFSISGEVSSATNANAGCRAAVGISLRHPPVVSSPFLEPLLFPPPWYLILSCLHSFTSV